MNTTRLSYRRLFTVAGLLICGRPVIALEPPVVDFSSYRTKSPWVVPREVIERRTPGSVAETNFDEARVPAYSLPEMLNLQSGEKVETKEIWENQRRAELLELFRSEIFGVSPPRPADLTFGIVEENSNALAAAATFKRIAIRFSLDNTAFQFHLKLFVPNHATQPAPVVVVLNHREASITDETRQVQNEYWPVEYIISRGYATAAIDVSVEVDPDEHQFDDGVRAFYRKHAVAPERWTWGTIGAWAWAASRAVDYLVTDQDIDHKKIAVIGHSRTGKTSLWAGAQDTRLSLVIPSNAGDAGPALVRRRFGNTIEVMTGRNPHWFIPKYATYAGREASLPVDQHMLIALVAPRGYHGGDGAEDLWHDPRGAWLALEEASKVWELYGYKTSLNMPLVNDLLVAGPIAYHIRQGGHGLRLYDWKLYLDHADLLFQDKD